MRRTGIQDAGQTNQGEWSSLLQNEGSSQGSQSRKWRPVKPSCPSISLSGGVDFAKEGVQGFFYNHDKMNYWFSTTLMIAVVYNIVLMAMQNYAEETSEKFHGLITKMYFDVLFPFINIVALAPAFMLAMGVLKKFEDAAVWAFKRVTRIPVKPWALIPRSEEELGSVSHGDRALDPALRQKVLFPLLPNVPILRRLMDLSAFSFKLSPRVAWCLWLVVSAMQLWTADSINPTVDAGHRVNDFYDVLGNEMLAVLVAPFVVAPLEAKLFDVVELAIQDERHRDEREARDNEGAGYAPQFPGRHWQLHNTGDLPNLLVRRIGYVATCNGRLFEWVKKCCPGRSADSGHDYVGGPDLGGDAAEHAEDGYGL